MDQLQNDVQEIFRDVFDDEEFVLREDITAADVEGWDSLAHINLIIAVEKKMGIKFATAEISRLNAEGANVGTMIEMIRKKKG